MADSNGSAYDLRELDIDERCSQCYVVSLRRTYLRDGSG
jgi:hypothetical protein